MSLGLSAGRRRPALLAAAAVAVTAATLASATSAFAGSDATAPGPQAAAGDGNYLVQLADTPVAIYDGTVAGLKATKPAAGARVDRSSPDVQKYVTYLDGRRDAVLAKVKGAKKLYDYNFTFTGFAATLTGKQAATLATTPGVLSVTKDEVRHVDTVTTTTMLGLTGPDGVWQKQFGGVDKAGDGVIVGVVDSGLWPENPSFAPLPASATDAKIKKRFKGICDAGLEAPYFTCNNKVIGGRYFVKGTGPDNVIKREFLSPRGYQSHGSHTASTAAGDNGVPATIDGIDLGKVSGMAPAARIAVYKVCWGTDEATGGGGCNTVDSVAAIDQAVADGVDVINFSISGSLTTAADPAELAFFRAAQAGVFVAASAGNSGPPASTVAHNDPWVTTVAAGTHDRSFAATVALGNGKSYTGVGLGAAVPSAPLALSSAVAKSGATEHDARLCFAGALDPVKTTGKIVVCDRGENGRTEKSQSVKDAGGVGVVLANTSPNSLNADLHVLPTVHLDDVSGAAVKAYAADPAATASLSKGVPVPGVEAPKVAAFSSRGPALAGSGDLLKPDIMAPGVDVLAAVSPMEGKGRNFDLLSGTSMASPHIAGLAALVIGKHPAWSPMAVKSALMTTATTRDNKSQPIVTDSNGPAGALDYGSGWVVPAKSFNPGLVYDSAPKDWVRYLCGTGDLPASSTDCAAAGGAIDPSDFNSPSLAIGALPGIQTVTRTVTSVAAKAQTYVAAVEAPAGTTVTVSPAKFTLAPGAKKSFKVTITRVSAPYGAYTTGGLTWSDGAHQVRIPIAVRPVAVAAPVQAGGKGTSGSVSVPVSAGYTGTLFSAVSGLVPAAVSAGTVQNPTGQQFPEAQPVASEHTAKFTVSVPAGTKLARFSTFDADYPDGSDLDIFLYKAGTATQVGKSTGGTAEEQVDVVAPAAGDYDVYVDLYAVGGGGSSLNVKLDSWALGSGAAGNAAATPASQAVTIAKPTAVTVTWTGLAPGQRWLGSLDFSDGTAPAGATLIRVDS
ncbi:MAG: protease-associated domain protein [Actinomycetia bacterium]|nr:protease-associated domain protein [Actinomycetes bacterium]